jgi:fused signal recognition particle receptor
MGFFDKLRQGLTRTTQQIVGRFDDIVEKADAQEKRTRTIDVETVEALEEVLISADVGIPATERIVGAVKARARRGESLRELVTQEILAIFEAVERPVANSHHPRVTLIVGVNGTGKTTTIGKLANLFKSEGKDSANRCR